MEYKLPKVLDEKVARLHLKSLGAKLTVLDKEKTEYIGLPVEGPFKKEVKSEFMCPNIGVMNSISVWVFSAPYL
jgi:hypothetical protein